MAIKYKRCPQCGSQDSLNILYGMPTYEMSLEEKAGKCKLGGCMILEGAPEYYCKNCENEWNRSDAIEAEYAKIKGIIAEVGQFHGPTYQVDINFSTRVILWQENSHGEANQVRKTMDPEEAKQFREQLQFRDVLNWKRKYIEPHILDGTQWSIELVRDGRNIKKYGSNKFPLDWLFFCGDIQRITGEKFE